MNRRGTRRTARRNAEDGTPVEVCPGRARTAWKWPRDAMTSRGRSSGIPGSWRSEPDTVCSHLRSSAPSSAFLRVPPRFNVGYACGGAPSSSARHLPRVLATQPDSHDLILDVSDRIHRPDPRTRDGGVAAQRASAVDRRRRRGADRTRNPHGNQPDQAEGSSDHLIGASDGLSPQLPVTSAGASPPVRRAIEAAFARTSGRVRQATEWRPSGAGRSRRPGTRTSRFRSLVHLPITPLAPHGALTSRRGSVSSALSSASGRGRCNPFH